MPRHVEAGRMLGPLSPLDTLAPGAVAAAPSAAAAVVIDPVERRLSGVVGGALWILGGALLAILPLFSGFLPSTHRGLVVALSVASVAWGVAHIWLIDWIDAPSWLRHGSAVAGLAVAGFATWATGGGDSPVGAYICWLSLFGCSFYVARVATAYMLACVLVQALPLSYDPRVADGGTFLVLLLIFAVGQLIIGGGLIAGKALHTGRRRQAEVDAFTDSLTGLANHRVLDLSLAAQTRRITQFGSLLSVVVLDIDSFKQINDTGGHADGDRALVFVARCLSEVATGKDVLTRSGGDEFTWLMPGLDAVAARDRLERARALIQVPRLPALTISAGICDSTQAADPGRLVALADGALYWSKAHGRARSLIYDPDVVDALSADERADNLERSQALTGLRALARATDAKAPHTRGHSERVAMIAARMARAADWDERRAALLREAALLHDVGRIGVEEELATRRLSALEHARLTADPQLSGRIVSGILSTEQVSWIRSIHERADGGGAPLGLLGTAIPDGARLLAVADAFDVMTVGSVHRVGYSQEHALAECRAAIGREFTAEAVAALERALDSQPAVAAADLVTWRHRAEVEGADATDPRFGSTGA